jgi:hypothetical protein
MLMGLSVVTLLGFGALGIDVAYIAMASTQASAVSDAASHAALLTFRRAPGNEASRMADGVQAAQWVVDNNRVGFSGPGNMDALEFGIFNSAAGTFNAGSSPANAARAAVSRKDGNGIELVLAPIIGIERADIEQSSVAVANPREIVVVIDRSGSMLSGTPLSGRAGTDLALEAFSDYMVDHRVPLDRLGATWFNSDGQWWDPLRYIEGNQGAILAKWSTWDAIHIEANWCTNQKAGIDPATTALVGSGNDLAFKAIIVISDGNPTCGAGAAGFTNATAAAWGHGIHVWTVAFGAHINDALMTAATRGLGTYERTPNSTGLSAVMLKIAESIPVALVQ